MEYNVTVAEVLRVREVCGQCEHAKPGDGYTYCMKFKTDSVIFLRDRCDVLKQPTP